jgi:hypothetical protein
MVDLRCTACWGEWSVWEGDVPMACRFCERSGYVTVVEHVLVLPEDWA